jgi:predicted DNA-binding transcriptional regulator AlpA
MATFNFLSTRQVATLLGIKPASLSLAVWARRLPEPSRIGRSFAWGEEDVARAARAFGLKFVRRVDGGPLTGVAAAPPAETSPAIGGV